MNSTNHNLGKSGWGGIDLDQEDQECSEAPAKNEHYKFATRSCLNLWVVGMQIGNSPVPGDVPGKAQSINLGHDLLILGSASQGTAALAI